MTAAFFDSHNYYKRLIEAGMAPSTADVRAEMMFELMSWIAVVSAEAKKRGMIPNPNATTFDTHKWSMRLAKAGMTRAVADVEAETMFDAMTQVAFILPTTKTQGMVFDMTTDRWEVKFDTPAARLEAKLDKLGGKIDNFGADLTAEIECLKNDIKRWVIGVAIAVSLVQVSAITVLAMKLTH